MYHSYVENGVGEFLIAKKSVNDLQIELISYANTSVIVQNTWLDTYYS
jgi:hypothetical protein